MVYKSVFLDSSYLLSLLIDSDSNHNKSTELVTLIKDVKTIYMSNLVYAEVVTVLSQRLGKSNFIRAYSELSSLNVTELFVNPAMDLEVRNHFIKIQKKDISYVDVSTAYLASEHSISTIITFDKHFKHLGKYFGIKILGV